MNDASDKLQFPLRPFMPADTMALRELFAQSIEELTQDDYTEDERAAWAATAADAPAFAARLGSMLTLVVQIDGDYAGFASLKDNAVIDLLFVHPFQVHQGIGTTLCDALERVAKARGAAEITVDACETTAPFFQKRGFVATRRNSVPLDDQWLTNTTLSKKLAVAGAELLPAKP